MKDEEKYNEQKQTEKERIKQVRERIRNSDIFVDKTQPGNGTAIVGGTRQNPDRNDE